MLKFMSTFFPPQGSINTLMDLLSLSFLSTCLCKGPTYLCLTFTYISATGPMPRFISFPLQLFWSPFLLGLTFTFRLMALYSSPLFTIGLIQGLFLTSQLNSKSLESHLWIKIKTQLYLLPSLSPYLL